MASGNLLVWTLTLKNGYCQATFKADTCKPAQPHIAASVIWAFHFLCSISMLFHCPIYSLCAQMKSLLFSSWLINHTSGPELTKTAAVRWHRGNTMEILAGDKCHLIGESSRWGQKESCSSTARGVGFSNRRTSEVCKSLPPLQQWYMYVRFLQVTPVCYPRPWSYFTFSFKGQQCVQQSVCTCATWPFYFCPEINTRSVCLFCRSQTQPAINTPHLKGQFRAIFRLCRGRINWKIPPARILCRT